MTNAATPPRDATSAALPPGVRGLTSAEAAQRLAADGPNRLAPLEPGRRLRRFLGPLKDPMVILLLVAAPTYLLIGDVVDAIVALAAILPVAGVGWLLEERAERTLERLRQVTAPGATVWRGGTPLRVPAESLVRGDVVLVREGDVVPADARILELTQLGTDEAALTGESLPVQKSAGDTVYAGTTVSSGRATVEVTATGARTRYGAIGTLVASVATHATPLQRVLARLVRWLSVLAIVLCALVMAIALARGNGWADAIIAAVSLGIAAIPEEFALVYGLYLSLGAWRLARDHALVRRLPAVETLGSATVICADKTGTLTEGRLAVSHLATLDDDPARVRLLAEAAVLASEPDPFDPLDRAITAHARG